MSLDLTNIQMSSLASSNKLYLTSASSFFIPANPGNTTVSTTVTIPHGFGSDALTFQIYVIIDSGNVQAVPWISNDGRVSVYGYIDSTNVYLTGVSSSSSAFSVPQKLVEYLIKILVP